MARQIDSEISGVIDNLIFYERQGEYFIRSVPVQTIPSQKSAKRYGLASSKAKVLRQLLLPLLPNPKDRGMQNRLTPAMRKFLSAISDNLSMTPFDNPLAGFRFVGTSDLKNCLHFSIGITQQDHGNILVEIPAINPHQSISAPEGTSRVDLRLMVVAFGTNNTSYFAGHPEVFHIPFENQMQPKMIRVLKMRAEGGSIIIITAALSYWNNNQNIGEAGFMPVEIVGVFAND